MRINFGCGKKALAGWFNVDAVMRPGVDLVHAVTFDTHGEITAPLPLADGCAEEVMALHVVEHVYAWEAAALVGEWRRLLHPGGLLVLELPNLECAARNLLKGLDDQMVMWPLYGDPGHRDPYMCHRWGYTPQSITALLTDHGFRKVRIPPPQTHGRRMDRDMRVEARKA